MAKHLAAERAYETLFVCPTDTPQKTIDTFIEKIKTAISPTKGVLRSVQIWGRRKLTYPIKHQKDGLYIFIDYTGEPGTTEALKSLFRVTDFVIRYVTTDKMNLRPPYVRKSPVPGEPTEAAHAPAAAQASTSTTETPQATPSQK
ncbi:MAG: 30S ribosomal protein S6 [Elusimicrobia bacterium]|nr:30S ribosomal protein S6 [Elusimicrobiota bacterium]